ncbi:MAG: GGDEF domain-containing protein [Devosia sp.]
MNIKDLPGAAWASIFRWTSILMVVSVGLSVVVSQIIMSTLSQGLNGPGLAAAIVLPLLLGGPTSFWYLVRLQQLKLANRKLHILASTDWLTTCLNRRAFTHAVSDQLSMAQRLPGAADGAFLVIDADHFKIINDHYGHDRGDEALQLMAEIIKSKVRNGDLVGRIGGEEFGVFLKDADFETASLIAERIRDGIRMAAFAPDGTAHPLSVSVGGAVFGGEIGFTELFRVADQKLYRAKRLGRNRVEIDHANGQPVARLDSPQLRLNLAKAG